MTFASALVAVVGFGAPVAAPAVAATQSAVAVDPDRSPGNARMTDGVGEQVQAFELEAVVAPSVLFGDPANPGYQQSHSRWGFAVSGTLTYRPRYFLNPHVEFSYAWLASGESQLPEGPWGAGGKVEQSLRAWTLSPGVTFPFWRFRLLAGIGITKALQDTVVAGEENSSGQIGLLQRVALSFDAVKTERTRLAAVINYQNSGGLKLQWLTLGVSFRGDFVQWD